MKTKPRAFTSLAYCTTSTRLVLPAFAIAIVGLAVVEKDGAAVLAGLAVGVVSLMVAATVIVGFIKAFLLLFSGMFG